ncbi:MAG: hypothetical protein AB3N12_02860 [Ruegeria sp.]
MPLNSVLNRVFATNTFQDSKIARSSAIPSDPNLAKKSISKVEAAAALRDILEDEQMAHPAYRPGKDSSQ